MNIRQMLIDKKLTQKELAEKVGCSLDSVKSWATGRRNPSEKMMAKIKKVLK